MDKIEFCFLSSKVQCRAFCVPGGKCTLEYLSNGRWHLAFHLASYRNVVQFIEYCVEPIQDIEKVEE